MATQRTVKTIRLHPDDVARNAAALKALHRSAGGYVTKATEVATAGWSHIVGTYADAKAGDPIGKARWAAFSLEEPGLARLVPHVVDQFNEGHAVGDLLAQMEARGLVSGDHGDALADFYADDPLPGDEAITSYRPHPALKAAGQGAERPGLNATKRAYLDRVYRTDPDPAARSQAYRLLHENDG